MSYRLFLAATLVLTLTALGCTSHRGYRQAQLAEQTEDWDQAVAQYLELVNRHPGKITYKSGLVRAKLRASQDHFGKGKKFMEAGALEPAYLEFQQAVQLDPTNQYAQVELEKVRTGLQEARLAAGDQTLQDLKDRNQGRRPQPPTLNPRSNEPISLTFPSKVSIFDVYRALGKAFGINIQYDSKLRDQEIAIELEDVIAQEALEFVMRAGGHFYKVLNETSIIVAEDNPQNRRNYEDLVIQTFFLSNAEVKDQMTILRSLVGAKNIAANDQQNAIVLRDTADKVKVAERIISTNDKARGEVVVDVELLQIDTNRMRDLGVSLSSYQVTQSLDIDTPRVSDLQFLNQGNWVLTLPGFIYDFMKTSSDAQLLASPHLRISDGETASLLIGERVPIPVTSFNTAQTVGGDIIPITSFQYQDIGIRLEIEPRIHHNKEITLALTIEVSNLSGFTGGQPNIGTRTIESTIRLQDGETNFLAGLIRTDEVESETGVPGLSDIPVLGRLFSKKTVTKERSDLVLTLTPHIIRTPDITEEDLMPIWVGTETNITFRGGSPRVESEVSGPFDQGNGGEEDEEEIRDMIRRRIQNLPRGLRDQNGEDSDDESEEPRGLDLAPSAGPTDFFGNPTDDGDNQSNIDLDHLEGDSDDNYRIAYADGIIWGSPPAIPVALGRVELEPVTAYAPSAETDSVVTGYVAAYEAAAEAAAAQGGAAGESVAEPVRITLGWPERPVGVGEIFEIEIQAQTAKAISHMPAELVFDPTLFEYLGVTSGGFLGSEGESQILADDATPGTLVIGASRLGRVRGAKGSGSVVRVRLKALREGRGKVSLSQVKALDRKLQPLKVLGDHSAVVRVRGVYSPPAGLNEAPPSLPFKRGDEVDPRENRGR